MLHHPTECELREHYDVLKRQSRGRSIDDADLAFVGANARRHPSVPHKLARSDALLDVIVRLCEDFVRGQADGPRVAFTSLAAMEARRYRLKNLGADTFLEDRERFLEIAARMTVEVPEESVTNQSLVQDTRIYDAAKNLDAERFGRNLSDARLRLGFSQEKAAFKCHVSSAAFRDWEHGRHLPHGLHLLQVCRVLRTSRHELFERD